MRALSLQSLNLNALYCFWVVAKTGSISGAAQELARAQPTLSIQLRRLERQLRVQLLTRTRSGTVLTPEGEKVFAYCQRIFTEAVSLLSLPGVRTGTRSPVFRLGVTCTISRERLLMLESALSNISPNTTKSIEIQGNEVLKNKLRRHELDLLLSDEDFSAEIGKDYIGFPWDRVPVCFVAAKGARKRAGSFPSCLSRIPLLLRTSACTTRKAVDMFMYKHGISPLIRTESDDIGLLKLMAACGRGAACIDEEALKADSGPIKMEKLNKFPVGIYEQGWLIFNRRRGAFSMVAMPVQAILDRLTSNIPVERARILGRRA